MAYDPTVARPRMLVQGVGKSPSLWVYVSADQEAALDAAGYFTDATDLGMKVNDIVYLIDTTGNLFHIVHVKTITAGAASLFEATAFSGA